MSEGFYGGVDECKTQNRVIMALALLLVVVVLSWLAVHFGWFKSGEATPVVAATTTAAPASGFTAKKFPQVYERSDGNGFTTERLVETRSLAPQWVPSEWSLSDRADNDKAAIQGNTTIDGFAPSKSVDDKLLSAFHGN